MDIILRFEEELEEKEALLAAANARIEELEGRRTWKDIAKDALLSGMKQKDVAELVSKSLPSIKKLSSEMKKETTS